MRTRFLALVLLVLFSASLACQLSGGEEPEEPTQVPVATSEEVQAQPTQAEEPEEPTEAVEPTQLPEEPEPQLVELRQWADEAEASNQHGDDEWSARQATGEPNTMGCGRAPFSWTGYYQDGGAYIDLTYETAVIPTEINIYQNYNPDAVTEVWFYETEFGGLREVYKATPESKECPYILSIPVEDADYRAQTIRIWTDHEVMGDFTEIDAVELVGLVEGEPSAGLPPTESAPEQAPPTPASSAQTAPFDPTAWTWTIYDTSNGLPEDLIVDITTAGDSSVWAATGNEGVISFDGQSWTTYTSDEGPQVNYANTIEVAPDGTVWFGGYGLTSYDGTNVQKYNSDDGLLNNAVESLEFAPDGTLWIGMNKGVSSYDGQNFTNFGTEAGIPDANNEDIAITQSGTVWTGTWDGAAAKGGASWTVFTDGDGLAGSKVNAIAVAPDGTLWFGTWSGVSTMDENDWGVFQNIEEMNYMAVGDISVAPDGELWFAVQGSGAMRFDGREWLTLTAADGLPSDWIDAIAIALDGTVWFASRDAGIARLSPP